jgi:Zinc carboxypeptidase
VLVAQNAPSGHGFDRWRRRHRVRTTAELGVLACVLSALTIANPGVATAQSTDPTVAAAVAELGNLGLTQLTSMPSGRTTYRTYDDFNNEMQALASANPGFVAVKTAPYRSVEGREIKYLEITNDVNSQDGKPVYFAMASIHGVETPSGEEALEFAYDVVQKAKTTPAVRALFDHVRLIDMPLVNPDGLVHQRRYNCAGATPPATCPTSNSLGVDLNRNYPFGWGSNIDVTFAHRGTGPGSEPEVKNTMEIVEHHQVVVLTTGHTNEHAIFYPPLDIAAGDTPDLNTGYGALGQALAAATNNGYTNVRDSAHDYETSGETIDWSYYATRGFAFTIEHSGGSGTGCGRITDNYLNCTAADYTGTPGPTSTAAQTATYNGHPARNAFWLSLIYASLPAGHAVIAGDAPPGSTVTIQKHLDLYTAPILENTTPVTTEPPQAIPTDLDSTLAVEHNGHFTAAVNPSVRPTPAFRADGEHPGPNGFLPESWTLTCQTPHSGTHELTITIDKGQQVNLASCPSWPNSAVR